MQEIGAKLGDASDSRRIEEKKKEKEEEPIIVLAEGTKTHSIYQTQNNVKVAILYDQKKSGEKRIVSMHRCEQQRLEGRGGEEDTE